MGSCLVVSDSLRPCGSVARQAPLSMEFSRQEYWSRLPFPTPKGIFPTQGWNLSLLHWLVDFFYHWATFEAHKNIPIISKNVLVFFCVVWIQSIPLTYFKEYNTVLLTLFAMLYPWRRKWQPTPVFLPGKFHGQRSLAGYNWWGCKSDTT